MADIPTVSDTAFDTTIDILASLDSSIVVFLTSAEQPAVVILREDLIWT